MAGLGLGNISEKQEKAIIALLSQPTIGKAAIAAGVGERTLHTWLDDPDFVRAYCAARRRAFKHAVSIAQHYAPLAVQSLARIANNEKAPAAARVTACGLLLKFGRDSIELEDLQARMDLLEASAGLSTRKIVESVSSPAGESRPEAPPSPDEPVSAPPAVPVALPPPRVKRGRKPGPQAPRRKAAAR